MKILAVCGLGQGTSLILRMNIEQVLQEKGVDADVEHTDVSAAGSEETDYIVTSNELAESLENQQAKILIVNNYFDKDEISKVFSENGLF